MLPHTWRHVIFVVRVRKRSIVHLSKHRNYQYRYRRIGVDINTLSISYQYHSYFYSQYQYLLSAILLKSVINNPDFYCHYCDRLKEQCNEDIQQVNEEKLKVEQVVSGLKTELRTTQQDLEEQKEANARAPSQTIKSLVERLKNQLALKEKQQQVDCLHLLDSPKCLQVSWRA